VTGLRLPKKGERITIRWPGGPYDFVMIFDKVAPGWGSGPDGYEFLRGLIVEPPSEWPDYRVLYARPTGQPGEYTLVGNKAPGSEPAG
jgi:hypothetical protein